MPYLWKNIKFNTQLLSHIDHDNISSQFKYICEKYPKKICVKVYAGNDCIIKTYTDLYSDIQKCVQHIKLSEKKIDLAVCLGSNTYQNIINTLACIRLNISIIPMNIDEPEARIQDKIQRLNKNLSLLILNETNENYNYFEKKTTLKQSLSQSQTLAEKPLLFIYSSGTTGEPKIAAISESAVLANIDALIQHHSIHQHTKILTPLPIFHVNALCFSLLTALLTGAELILVKGLNFPALKKILESEKIQIFSLVPSFLKILYQNAEKLNWNFIDIDYVLTAAAPLSTDLVSDWYKKTKIPVIQGYGMSEAVNFSTTLDIDLNSADYNQLMIQQKFPSIGHELNFNSVYILRPDGSEASPDEEGHIFIQGWNLMLGYYNPELNTIEKLEDKLLTGDIGYYKIIKNKKYFFISGREKEIIKKSGVNISLREIDDFINHRCNLACDAITVAVPDLIHGENYAVIFSEDISQINFEHLIEKIITYFGLMYKTDLYKITSMPLRTASGKAQRAEYKKMFRQN
jgi:acyl-CoA synthetase (AMP-forming)/AMP-acid ligase II